MKTTAPFIALCATTALLCGPACSQSEPTNTNSASSPQSTDLQEARAQEFFRSSQMVGKDTQDSKGTKVGEIQDIAFNQQGQLFAFVDVGGGKWAVVPWQALKPETAKGSGNVTINATEQELKAGPAVTKDQWGSLNNPQFVQGCYAYYHVQSPTAAGGAASPGGTSESHGQSSPTNSPSTPPGP